MRSEHFRDNGYCIIPRLISPALIDAFLREYELAVRPSRQYFYRQTNRFERNRVDRHGHVLNSYLQVHSFDQPAGPSHFTAPFSEAARRILTSRDLRDALTEVTGEAGHVLVQSMFFDKNMATEPHQDNYYLDSVPSGRLLGCWFALEDIHEDAGRFFVMRDSHRVKFDVDWDERRVNRLYLRKLKRYFNTNRSSVIAPGLRKGDVLFWSSTTIHGSLPTRDRAHSRRSLTAHYIPADARFGRITFETKHNMDRMEFDGMKLWRYCLSDYQPPPLIDRLWSLITDQTSSFSAHPTIYKAIKAVKRAREVSKRLNTTRTRRPR